jgi:hypothetical protein
MHRFWKSIVRQFKTLDLVPEYFRSVKTEAWNLAWGPGLIAIAFCLWWSQRPTPMPSLNVAIFLGGALVLAGYYLWRADHLRLMPKLGLQDCAPQFTPGEPGQVKVYLHILPECLTDQSIEECEGYLVGVWKYSETTWIKTEPSETVELKWSPNISGPITLQPGVPRKLIVCWISNKTGQRINLEGSWIPLRAKPLLTFPSILRFDIRVTAKDCPPVDISLSVQFGATWDIPMVVQRQTNQ